MIATPTRALVNEDGSVPRSVTLGDGCRVTIFPDDGGDPYLATVANRGDEGDEVRVEPGGCVDSRAERRVPRAWVRKGWPDPQPTKAAPGARPRKTGAELLEALFPRALSDVLGLDPSEAVEVKLAEDFTIVTLTINGQPPTEAHWAALERCGLVTVDSAPFPRRARWAT